MFEAIGLWLAGALRGELARLGDLAFGLLSWLVEVNGQALGSLLDPLAIWLVLLSLLTLRVLTNRPARMHTRRPIRGVR